MHAWYYEPGIKNHSIYMKLPSNPWMHIKLIGNAIIIAQNRNNNITP